MRNPKTKRAILRSRLELLIASLSLALAVPFAAGAQDIASGSVMIITAPAAMIYSSPNQPTKTVLQRGRRVQTAGAALNGFVPLATKNGARNAWIKLTDVSPEVDAAAKDIVNPRAAKAANENQAANVENQDEEPSERGFLGTKGITYDLGLSAGSVGTVSYTEAYLGLNLWFEKWVVWRNAVFGRFQGGETQLGLDTSARGVLSVNAKIAGLTAFAGPGYRFVNKGDNVPFLEGGVVVKLAGFSLGGGVKSLMSSWTRANAPNDTQYFLILAGGGSL